MKKITPFLIIMLLSMSVAYGNQNADESPVIKIFDKYEGKEGVESITISPALFGLMKSGKASDKKTQELILKISGLRILTLSDGADGKHRATREALVAELQAVIKKDFAEIMKVKSSGDQIELYMQHQPDCKDCQSALLFITSSNGEVAVMYLTGTIDKVLIDAVMNGEIGI